MVLERLPDVSIENVGEAIEVIAGNPVVKLIPPFVKVISLVKVANSFSDRILGMAILRFVHTVDKSDFWREMWKDKTTKSPRRCKKVGKALLMALQRTDDVNKAEILGILFVAHAGRVITDTELIRLSQSVNKCATEDILNLIKSENALKHSTDPWMSYLQAANLTEYVVQRMNDVGSLRHFDTTEEGQRFREAYKYGYEHLYN